MTETETVSYEVRHVTWVDSARGPGEWEEIGDILSRQPLHIESVGFVVKEDDEHIILLQNFDLDNGTGNGLYSISIPKVAIKSMTTYGLDS